MCIIIRRPYTNGEYSLPGILVERLPFIARPGHKNEGHDVVSLPSSRTNKGVFPRHIIRDVSRDTLNGSASDGSRRVRYHYFNFTAEPPRIYLGARLMSLGIVPDSASAKIGDRNVRARSRLCTHELLINGIRVDRSASLAETLDDIVRSSKLDVSGLNISRMFSDSTCDLEFAYRTYLVFRHFFLSPDSLIRRQFFVNKYFIGL